jgi:amino acid adenylation domain-containing protein
MSVGIAVETLPDLFGRQARQTPGANALEDPEGRRLTYAELDTAATRMANALREAGVRPGDRVGISMPKSIDSVICVLGALKAGAVYVPVDFSAPPERNRYIFANCGTRVVCVDEPRAASLASQTEELAPLLVFPGDARESVGAPWLDECSAEWAEEASVSSDDLAYILYTSGSTGVPKGVMHTHRSALSFVRWAATIVEPTPSDRFSSHAPFHFDLSILDLYVPMTAGATVVLVGEELGKDPHNLATYIAERKITVWYSVPSILALLAQYGHLEEHGYGVLRTVLFAGEVFAIKHLRALMKLWPGKVYFNLYGPTETNVCTYYRIPDVVDDDRQVPYPIGVPCENVRAIVLDDSHRPVTGSEEGILYIHDSGPVMKGYWGMEDRTRDAFHVDDAGHRWYCTGDVVTTDPGGNYQYVGRRDRMVKRRGYRIELGEVEASLYRHPDVREAAAVAKDTDEGVVVTVFLSTKDSAKLSIIALKQFCARHLPAYMSPDRFLFVDRLPRTSTDKVDYQGLTRQV